MENQQLTSIQKLTSWLGHIGGIIWSPYLLIPLLLGVSIIMMFSLKFIPRRKLNLAFIIMWKSRRTQEGYEGELTPWHALMTSLAATVGTSNIVGVATAILISGPGTIFWMCIMATFGMATRFCEATLSVKYRDVTPDGSYVGGPMYYIKNGLGTN